MKLRYGKLPARHVRSQEPLPDVSRSSSSSLLSLWPRSWRQILCSLRILSAASPLPLSSFLFSSHPLPSQSEGYSHILQPYISCPTPRCLHLGNSRNQWEACNPFSLKDLPARSLFTISNSNLRGRTFLMFKIHLPAVLFTSRAGLGKLLSCSFPLFPPVLVPGPLPVGVGFLSPLRNPRPRQLCVSQVEGDERGGGRWGGDHKSSEHNSQISSDAQCEMWVLS